MAIQIRADSTNLPWQPYLAVKASFGTTTGASGVEHGAPWARRISEPSPLPAWVQQIFKRFEKLNQLPAGWDSYQAAPVSEQALRGARSLILSLPEVWSENADPRLIPFAIAPLANGGIQLEWRADALEIEVEVDPDTGSYDCLVLRDSKPAEAKRLSRRALADLITSMFA